MKKTFIFLVGLMLMSIFFITSTKVNAADNLTIIINDKEIEVDLLDPVKYSGSNAIFDDVTGKIVIYTAFWHYNSTKNTNNVTEYLVKIVNEDYQIVEKNINGNTYIPLDGFVISIPNTNPNTFEVGDIITTSKNDLIIPIIFGIENNQGVRLVVTKENVINNSVGINYFDKSFGKNSQANYQGTELAVMVDSTGTFKISEFRNTYDKYAIDIPNNGFVLHAMGSSFESQLRPNVKFKLDETVNIVGGQKNLNTNVIELDYHATNALRQKDFLVVYTDLYPAKTEEGYPDTNPYGYEAAVDESGYVIEVGIHAKIPNKGYVLSGNEKSEKLLMNNIKIGSKVTLDKTNKKVIIENNESEINFRTAYKLLESIELNINHAKEELLDVDLAKSDFSHKAALNLFDELEAIYQDIDQIDIEKALELRVKAFEIRQLVTDITYFLMPSMSVEGRGIWHRPEEGTLGELILKLDNLKKSGINMLHIETIYNGYALYESEYLELNPVIANGSYGKYGKDYFRALIDLAHERDIEVHAWTHVMRTSFTAKLYLENPDWFIKNSLGSTQITYYGPFMDPSNQNVRDYLAKIVDELLSKYNVDGFQFDYIRYPGPFEDKESAVELPNGFTDNALKIFKEETGFTGSINELLSNTNYLSKWNKFKQDNITEVVRIITEVVRKYPGVEISMDVSPDPQFAKENYMQDWTRWVKNGWIDTVYPMIYMGDTSAVVGYSKNTLNYINNLSYQYTGIAPIYYGFSAMINQEQIVALQDFTLGNSIFDYYTFFRYPNTSEILQMSTNRKQAVRPSDNAKLVVETIINEIIEQAEKIYIPNNKMTEDQFSILKTELLKIVNMNMNNARELNELKDKLETIEAYTVMYAEGKAVERIKESLNRLINIIDIKISRDLINRGFWNPEFELDRPDPNNFEYPVIVEPIDNNNNKNIILYTSIAAGTLLLGTAGFAIFKKIKVKK